MKRARKMRRGERILRVNNVIIPAAAAVLGFHFSPCAFGDISLGSSWVSNGSGGYDSFHDYNASDVLTPTVRANNDTWLRVDNHDQYYSYLAADANPDLTVANIAANPDMQFDLDLTEWDWPSMYGYVEYFSSNPAGGGFDGQVIFSNNSAAFVNGVNHISVDLSSILSPGGQTRVDTTNLNIGIAIEPAYGTGGTFVPLANHYFIDNVALTPVPPPPPIGSGEWKTAGAGTWSGSLATNWDPAIPNAVDNAATFGTYNGSITIPTTVTVAGGVTVGTINFDNPAGYTLNGSAITLDTATTGDHGVLTAINVLSGSHTINSTVVKGANANPIDFNVVPANSTLTIPNLAGQFYTFQKDGAGTLVVNRAQDVTLLVNGGTVKMLPNGTNSGVNVAFFVNVASGATVDIANNSFLYDYTGTSPEDDVRNYLSQGYAGGRWTGTGITSSTAAAAATSAHRTAIGYVDTADPGVADAIVNWTDQTIDADTIMMRYTLAGDSNLDLNVDTSDFTALSQNFGASGQHWFSGDFNYDGVVNALDFNALASNFGATFASPVMGSAVPEPASLAAISVAAMFFVRRRSK